MSHKPRLWPTIAKNARDDAAAEACKAIRVLLPILDREMTKEELYRRTGIVINSLQMIARLLLQVGAEIRIDNFSQTEMDKQK